MRFELPVFTFRGLQRRESRFRHISHVDRDRFEVFREIQQEVGELSEAVQRGDRTEIQCEVDDLVILASEMANAEKFDLQKSLNGKLRRNSDKYNPRALRRLQKEWGLTPDESMDFARSHWDRNRDTQYFK